MVNFVEDIVLVVGEVILVVVIIFVFVVVIIFVFVLGILLDNVFIGEFVGNLFWSIGSSFVCFSSF